MKTSLATVLFFAVFIITALSPRAALATDEIICDSKTFKASFAVGSDGYVTIMVLSDSSAKYFSNVLEVTNMSKRNRHVFIPEKTVNVKAFLGKRNANRLTINIKNGKGYIELDSHKEEMVCDWDI